VWENETGGLTFDVAAGADRCFVKWSPGSSDVDLNGEVARLGWAADYTPVPRVLAAGADEFGSWIVTAPLAGESAVSLRWKADPHRAVMAIGRGLRAMHDVLPVDGCPFSWSAADRYDDARRRAAAGLIDPASWHESNRHVGLPAAVAVLADAPPIDRLVVCHGDACAPNTLIDEAGEWSGHVDLGSLGVADRWADLAVATWSTEWNYGPGWEGVLLAAYGVDADPARTAFYRLLWDLGP
jgi:kanamycin kinase